MRRHAGKHEMACRWLDDRLGLFAAYVENMSADQAMEDLCAAVFERPASTASEVRVQAVMLRAYCNTADKVDGFIKGWRASVSGRYGEKLACNLAGVETAA